MPSYDFLMDRTPPSGSSFSFNLPQSKFYQFSSPPHRAFSLFATPAALSLWYLNQTDKKMLRGGKYDGVLTSVSRDFAIKISANPQSSCVRGKWKCQKGTSITEKKKCSVFLLSPPDLLLLS